MIGAYQSTKKRSNKMNIKKFVVVLSILAVLVAGSVVSVGALTPLHVSSLKATYAAGHIKATVRVLDSLNKPVSNAAVKVSFEKEGAPIIFRTGMTNNNGVVARSATVPAGKWLVCVEEIHKIGYEYNPLKNTCTIIQVP
jgi:hypothetical protein